MYLALDRCRVDRLATVDRGVELGHLGDAGLGVDFDLRDGGMVVEGGDAITLHVLSRGGALRVEVRGSDGELLQLEMSEPGGRPDRHAPLGVVDVLDEAGLESQVLGIERPARIAAASKRTSLTCAAALMRALPPTNVPRELTVPKSYGVVPVSAV